MELGFYNEEALRALLAVDPEVQHALIEEGNRIVPVAKASLGAVKWPGVGPGAPRGGPPYWRSGYLRDKVETIEGERVDGLPTALVVSDTPYTEWLLDRGWVFLTGAQLESLGFSLTKD